MLVVAGRLVVQHASEVITIFFQKPLTLPTEVGRGNTKVSAEVWVPIRLSHIFITQWRINCKLIAKHYKIFFQHSSQLAHAKFSLFRKCSGLDGDLSSEILVFAGLENKMKTTKGIVKELLAKIIKAKKNLKVFLIDLANFAFHIH